MLSLCVYYDLYGSDGFREMQRNREFSNLLPVWPGLAEFSYFGEHFKNLGIFYVFIFVFGKIVKLFCHFYGIGQMLIFVDGQILNK